MNKFNKLFKQMVNEDVDSGKYAILYGRTVYPVGSIMDDCPFEETGKVRILGIDKKGVQVYDVHLASFLHNHSDSEYEGYTHTVDQSRPPGAKDETGNNINIKIVNIRS